MTVPKDKNRVYYLGAVIDDIDPETISILSTYFAKDNKHIIWNGKIIDNIDTSFTIVNQYFAKDKNHLYDQRNVKPVDGADAKSIRSINNRYSKDRKQVYLEYDVIPGADPKTFSIVDSTTYNISKDKNAVYINRYPFPESDPKTFTLLKDGYMKDKNQVYYNYNTLKNADPASFEFIPDRNGYTRDKNHLYYGGQLLAGINSKNMTFFGEYVLDSCAYFANRQLRFVDIASFEVLSYRIAKDKNNIYYCDRVIKTSIASMAPDLASFSAVPHSHSKDASLVYFKDRRRVFFMNNQAELEQIGVADPNTFIEINARYGKDHRYVYMGNTYIDADPVTFRLNSQDISYATDKNRAYYNGKPLAESDPDTFEIIPYTAYSKDALHVWHYAELMPDADGKTFTRAGGDYFKDKNAVFYGTHKLNNVDPETFDPNNSPYKPVKRINPAI